MKNSEIEKETREKLERYFKSVSDKDVDINALLVNAIEVLANGLINDKNTKTPLEIVNNMDADLNGKWRGTINKIHDELLRTGTDAFDKPDLSIYQIAALQLSMIGNKNTARELLIDYYRTSFEIGAREVIGHQIQKVRNFAKKEKTDKTATTKKQKEAAKKVTYDEMARVIWRGNPRLSASAVASRILKKLPGAKIKSDTLARKISKLKP